METRIYSQRQIDDVRKDFQASGEPLQICYTSSAKFEALIEDDFGDHRSALGRKAIHESRARGGAYTPSWDERIRFTVKGGD